jgi:hypothetical protein
MNIIMVLLDSLNFHCLESYGATHVQTPNLARFAKRAVTFDQHFIASAPCMPARRDLLTGRQEFLWRGWGHIEPWDCHLAEDAHRLGYISQMITDHYHYWEDAAHGYFEPFDGVEFIRGHELDLWDTAPLQETPEWVRSIDRYRPQHWRRRGGWGSVYYGNARNFHEHESCFPCAQVMQQSAAWLSRNREHAHFFLWTEAFDPHEPQFLPLHYRTLYSPDGRDHPEFTCWPPYQNREETRRFLELTSEEELAWIRAQYYGKVTMVDHWFGHLLDRIPGHNATGGARAGRAGQRRSRSGNVAVGMGRRRCGDGRMAVRSGSDAGPSRGVRHRWHAALPAARRNGAGGCGGWHVGRWRRSAVTYMKMQPNDLILFQGDSITNAFRMPQEECNAYQLGAGYAMLVAAQLLAARPHDTFRFINRGVSGEGIQGVHRRWQEDCLALRPGIVSILVGVNDAIRAPRPALAPDVFAATYRDLLAETRRALPDIGGAWPEQWKLEHAEEAAALRKRLVPHVEAGRYLMWTDDEGESWSTPQPLGETLHVTNPVTGEKRPFGTQFTGIQLRHGPHAGRLLVPGRGFTQGAPFALFAYGHNYVVYSDDHGATWRPGGLTQTGTGEACLVELSDGTVYVNSRNESLRCRGYRAWDRSHDGGETFTESGYDLGLPEPHCAASIVRYSEYPNRILFCNPAVRSATNTHYDHAARRNLTARLSEDDGRT